MILIKIYFFLDNTYSNYLDGNRFEFYHDNLKELNEKNTELYIGNIKYKYLKYFRPIKEGIYTIKLKFHINITDCSFMFCCCENITNLDLSSFDTKNVIDMSFMFWRSDKLTSLDISSFDTINVTDMSYMFLYCHHITNLDFSSFDTKNVTDMGYMFSCCCINIKNFDLSSFDTRNVTYMKGIFDSCGLFNTIKIKKNLNEKLINLLPSYCKIKIIE